MRSTLAIFSAMLLGAAGFTLPSRALDDLVITEFMAENDNTLADEDGDFSDWVEIYNAGTNSVNLLGWKLTDKADASGAWTFPATNLPINSFIVVFCSGKDRRIAGQELHTDFKLNDTGDNLSLLGPDNTPRSSYTPYPLQVPGMTYGIPVTTTTTNLISQGAAAKFTVPVNDSLGIVWTTTGFSDSSWVSVNNGVGFEGEGLATSAPQLMADSVAEFSGNQGSNGWFYGYWNKKADADGFYAAEDFTPFPRGTGSVLNSTNYFDGTKWDIPAGNPPFTEITASGMYPSADNGNAALPVHWAIRRYVAEAAGPLRLSGLLASWNTNGTCGNGVIAHIIVDGVDVWQRASFGSSEAYSIIVNANLGSTIDFAVDAGANDFCDATTFTAQVRSTGGNSLVADTIRDWSTSGTQGEKGWSYGYFNQTLNPVYSTSGFVKFPSGSGPHSSANFWNGAAWEWFEGQPPFDTIGEVIMRPSQFPTGGASGNKHWVIRRWNSEVSGTLHIDWHASKRDTTTADVGSVVATVYQNGVQRDTITILGNDFFGTLRTVTLNGVQVGDPIDFVIASVDAVSGRCQLNAVIHGTSTLSNQFVSDVGALMTNINSSAYLRLPFTLPDATAVRGLSLRLKYDDGFVAYLNGTRVAAANAPETLAWNSISTGTRPDAEASQFQNFSLDEFRDFLVNGNNVLAIQGLNTSAGDPDFLLTAELVATRATLDRSGQRYFASPTPGALNGAGTTSLGPLITKIHHEPAEPADTEDLLVTALVSPTLNAVTNVSLYYRVMFGPETSVPMFDDGLHGDLGAGDGVYGASIPNSAYTSGQLVRYYVTSRDGANSLSRQPPLGDTNNSTLYFGTVVQNPALTNGLPVLHWFTQATISSTTFGRAVFYWKGELYDNVKMNVHGQSSQGFPNHSFNVDFNPDHHFKPDTNISRVDDINLLSSYADKAHMRVMLSYNIHGTAGARSPSHFAVPARMQSNGVFHSIMHIVENGDDNYLKRLDRDPNGSLYKMYTDPSLPANAEKKTRRWEDKSDFIALVAGINSATNRNFIYDNVDVSEAINFFAAMIVTANVDCCHKNFYLYRDSDGDKEWEMMPWDVDLSFGRNWQAGETYWDDRVYPNNGLFVGTTFPLGPFFFNNAVTRATYLRRVRTLQDEMLQVTNGIPTPELNFEKQIDSWTSIMAADGLLDLAKWGTWGGGNGGSGGGGTRIDNPTNQFYRTLAQSAAEMKTNYLVNRRKFVFDQKMGNTAEFPDSQPTNAVIQFGALDYNPGSGNQNEEFLQLTNPNNYAVDISGWKLSNAVEHTFQGGVVIPRAGSSNILYVVADKRAFRARAVAPKGGQGLYIEGPYKGQLSARGETLFLFDNKGRLVSTNLYLGNPSGAQQYLRVTELMYHPPRPPAGSPFDAEEFEYIELRNTGPTNIVLTGVHFSGGISFTFPASTLAPNAYVLVVRNLAAFTSRYGAGLNVAGQYSGILDNGGENIRLDDAVGEKILDFTYNNSWYPITDGPGASLVIVNDAADWRTWDQKASWRPSAIDGGSAGASDGTPATVLPILITEVLTHTDPPLVDAIELWNTNGTPVNLNGWFLTDDFAQPKKYVINGVTIPAGGYVVFYESNSFGSAFALSSHGDETYLFSGDGTHLTGFLHGYSYEAAENGVSFGRYVNSETNVHFVAQSINTLGAANAAPKVGPVVISEINYHPRGADSDVFEYVELANITATNVSLSDPAHPANTWRLRSAVDFNLPQGISLAAGEHILLVSFNPLDSTTLAKFRNRYSLDANSKILGPYSGNLGESESIKLYRPDSPDTNSTPYILVEQVDYSNQRPWSAAADGRGSSLQRLVESAYGNEPTNWIGAPPAAGVPYVPGGTAPTITKHPVDTVGVLGRTVQLSVEVSGTEPFVYQWLRNGVDLPDGTGRILTLANLQNNQAGTYSVIVANAAGSVESLPANLSVLLPVSIAVHPQPISLRGSTNAADYGFTTNNANFSVLANVQRPTRYQWRFNGGPLLNQTNSTLAVPNVGLAQDGVYDVIISDDISTVTSAPARLTVLVSPVFLLSPLTQLVPSNGTFTATVVVRGNPPIFRIEWREISTIRGSNTTSEMTNVFSYGPITNSSPRQWRLVVFNDANLTPGSLAPFNVSAIPDTDQDGIPDDWENQFGFNPGSNADRNTDSDGDGLSNYEEYIAGTDPTNALSYLRIDQAIVPGTATLQVNAQRTKSYTVRYNDALGSRPWAKLLDLPARANDHFESIVDPTWTSNRFYQLVTPAQTR